MWLTSAKGLLACCLMTVVFMSGCSDEGSTLGPEGAPDSGAPAAGGEGEGNGNGVGVPPGPTLARLSAEIFTPRCATSGCHSGTNPSRGLSLEEDRIARETIEVESNGSDLKLVDPGNPEGSYLLLKVRGDDGISGSRMPPSRPLSAEEIEKIRSWIASGAPVQ